jgi:hypothetical protein
MARQHLHQVLGPRRVTEDVAAVGVLGDQAQSFPLAAAADDDRNIATERLGLFRAPSTRKWRPSKVARSCVNMARAI